MTRVLVGVDGSTLAVHAAQRALALLDRSDLSVRVVSVVRPIVPIPSAGSVAGPLLGTEVGVADDVNVQAERAAQADVEAAARALGVPAQCRVVWGEPGPELCAIAEEGGFDVLVVGSHGSGFLKRIVLGSVSAHVLHHAPCPVLVVPLGEGD